MARNIVEALQQFDGLKMNSTEVAGVVPSDEGCQLEPSRVDDIEDGSDTDEVQGTEAAAEID